MKASGVSQELLGGIHQVLTWPATDRRADRGGDASRAGRRGTDVYGGGSPDEVKAKVREYIDHGCTCPILYPLSDAKVMIDIFADSYGTWFTNRHGGLMAAIPAKDNTEVYYRVGFTKPGRAFACQYTLPVNTINL